MTSEEARTEINTVLATLQNDTTEYGSQVSVNVTFTNKTGQEDKEGYIEMYLDAELDEVLLRMAGQGFTGSGSSSQSSFGYMVIGRMGQTSVFGADGSILSAYNSSAGDVEAFKDLDQLNPNTPAGGSSNPLFLFDALRYNITRDVDEFTAERITFQGEKALDIRSVSDADKEATLRVVIWTEPRRPALIEGRVTPEAAQNSDNLKSPGNIRMTFQYGDDASMGMRDDLTRVETMTYFVQGSSMTGQQPSKWTNHTIQPSRDLPEGEVALSEVVAHVTNRTFGGQGEEVLNMSLDQGSAESDEARLTYEDADSDGMVSEGDEIRLERLDENASLSLELEDTVTGLRVSPATTALGAMLAAGLGAALVARRD